MPTYYPQLDLSGSIIEDTFQRLIQNNSGSLVDGRGNSIDNISASNFVGTITSSANMIRLQCNNGNYYPLTCYNDNGTIILLIGQTPI